MPNFEKKTVGFVSVIVCITKEKKISGNDFKTKGISKVQI